MPRLIRLLRLAFVGLAVGVLVTLAGCAAPTRVLSHGPVYYGDRPISRLYVYFFIDMRPEYMPEAFRRVASAKLAEELKKSGIVSEDLWFSESAEGKFLMADFKNHTMGDTTSVSIGNVIRRNSDNDLALAPTHRLIVFPSETLRAGNGAVLNVKWDVLDARTGNFEWSVFTQTPVLSRSMDPAAAEAIAVGFVDAIIQEMRERNVIPRPKNNS